jgi:hypothetical protein
MRSVGRAIQRSEIDAPGSIFLLWRKSDIALSSSEGAKEETAMPSKILFADTLCEGIVAAPGSAEYVAALSFAEYLLGYVPGMAEASFRTAHTPRLVVAEGQEAGVKS